MVRVIQICAFFALSFSFLEAEFRTFTNDFGDSVEAELIKFKKEDSIIHMRLKNGRKIDAKLSAFSQADQKYIRTWWEEEVAAKQILHKQARVSVDVKIQTKTRNEGYKTYYSSRDNTVKVFYPELTIDNLNVQTFTDNVVRLVVFAKDMRHKDQILIVSAHDTKSDFKGQDEVLIESEPFRLRHYEYNSSYFNYDYESGYKYIGYAMTIKNSEGEVTHEQSTKPEFLNSDLFYKCKSGEIYDDKFKHKLNVSPNSYYVR